jgi:hypothetical protein
MSYLSFRSLKRNAFEVCSYINAASRAYPLLPSITTWYVVYVRLPLWNLPRIHWNHRWPLGSQEQGRVWLSFAVRIPSKGISNICRVSTTGIWSRRGSLKKIKITSWHLIININVDDRYLTFWTWIDIFGLAALHIMNPTLATMPMSTPYSNGRNKHAKNVINMSTKSFSADSINC